MNERAIAFKLSAENMLALNEKFTDVVNTGKQPFLVVFTDMDGTLIDHHSYKADDARPEIEALQSSGFPIVCISSKTRIEMERIRHEEGITDPYVSENGSAIFWDNERDGDVSIIGDGIVALRNVLDSMPIELRSKMTTFDDFGIAGIAEATGLNRENAGQASKRDATMPFIFDGTDAELVCVEEFLRGKGYMCPKGGRFYSVTPLDAGKEVALEQVVQHYKENMGSDWEVISVALGDGGNDAGMIKCADIGVVIPTPEGKHNVDTSGATNIIIHATNAGPKGWNDVIGAIRLSLESADRRELGVSHKLRL